MKAYKKLLIIPAVLVTFVAFAEIVYDQTFYSSEDFMATTPQVDIEVKVKAPVVVEKRVARREAVKPRVQRVELRDSNLVNGKWEVVRILNDKLLPVYDKNARYEDEKSEIIVDLELIDKSTVRINEDVDQTFLISMMTKRGTIALFKPFGTGYEILEARRINENRSSARVQKVVSSEPKLTKIEKRFEMNQELVLKSALNPTQSGEILKGEKVSGSIYLMGDQVMFENIALNVGSDKQTETLSFEAQIDGNTGHMNYNNEIQGIVSVVGDKEVRVRFSTGPLANAMLNFIVPGSDYNDGDDYEIEQRGGRPVPPINTPSRLNTPTKNTRDTASQNAANEEEFEQDEEAAEESLEEEDEEDIDGDEVAMNDGEVEKAGFEF